MLCQKTYAVAAGSLLIAAFPTFAQAKEPERSIYAPCAEIADNAQRLACFDATYAQESTLLADQAEEQRQETIEDFGLSAAQRERREAQSGTAAPAEDGSITAIVEEIFTDRRSNKRVFILDNGHVWAETQVSRMQRNPRVGQQVTVSKASLGGFRLRVEGKRGFVDVRRVR